jgi:outer membrane protein
LFIFAPDGVLNKKILIMKKVYLVLNVVLILAVGALYFFQFKGNKNSNKSAASGDVKGLPSEGIVYVNIDTIIYNFQMFKDRSNDLLTSQNKAEAELNSKGTTYQKNVADYTEKANKGLITRATATQMEAALTQQQQDLVNLSNTLQANLSEEETVMNRQVLEYIIKYLEEFKLQYNYQYILAKSFGSVVLYSDSTLDITSKVLEGVNKKYLSEKK